MSAQHRFAGLAAVFTLFFVIVTSTHATAVTGSSKYGEGPGTPGSTVSFSSCSAPTNTEPCEAFSPTDTTVGSYTLLQFAYVSNGASTVLDVVDVGTLAAAQTFFLPSTLLDPSTIQVFACGTQGTPFDGTSSVIDSSGNAVPLPSGYKGASCTSGTSATNANITFNGLTANGDSYTTDSGFNVIGDLVLASTVPVTAPEPGSLMLLGLGLVALAGVAFRAR